MMRMPTTVKKVPVALLSLLLITGVQAQNQQERRWSQQSDTRQNEQQQRTLRGTVDSVRTAQWRSSSGEQDQRCIVRLRLEDGRTTFVDVGSKSKLQNLSLSTGDQVQLSGRYANIRGREVFMANTVRVNGEAFTIQRSGQESAGSQVAQGSQARQGHTQTVQGQIDGFRHIYLRPQQGQRQQHSLVKLRLQDGRTLIVNLGPKRDLDDLSLQKGDRITLRGQRGMIDGRSVFFADQIRHGGETIQIARAGGNPRQPQASQQQGRQFTVRGKVAGYQVLTLDSGEKQVSLLNLRLDDGRSVLIDAGQNNEKLNLDQLDLRDRVVIQGHSRNVQGRQLLIADNIKFNAPQARSQESDQQRESSGRGTSGQSGQTGQSGQSDQQSQSNRQ